MHICVVPTPSLSMSFEWRATHLTCALDWQLMAPLNISIGRLWTLHAGER